MKAALVLIGLITPLALGATIQGTVRNAEGAAVAGATVQVADHIAQTDQKGIYRLALPAGSYTLRAQKTNLGEAAFGPFALADEIKNIDLVLKPAAESLGFFDEPTFTVAGVTDHTYVGGHGSDTMIRSSEALTREAATLSKSRGTGERDNEATLHHRLAEAAEKKGDPLVAVREYQRAAESEASDDNLFDWGTELLLHRAPQAAADVFASGIRLYPRSSRMLLASAVAFYAQGDYHQAGRYFFQASDLNPDDPNPYLFMAKVQSQEITESAGFLDRLARFVMLHPDNAWANYYYAAHLWNSRKDPQDVAIREQVQTLLQNALRLDPNFASAYLQLGVLYAGEQDFPAAIRAYQQAIQLDSALEQAHYRLAEAYRQTGDDQKAQLEINTFHHLEKKSAEQLQSQRSELQQFVVTLKSPAAAQ